MSLRQSLLRAARGSVLLRVGYLILTLGTSVVLARTLGPDGYGVYAFVLAAITVMAVPAQAGMPALLVRETAKAHALENWAVMKGVWHWVTRAILTTSALLAVLALITVWTMADHIGPTMLATIYTGLVLLPLLALGDARGGALRGLRLIVRSQVPDSIVRPALLLVLVGGTWRLTGELTAPVAMAWHVVAAAIAFVLGVVILWRARPLELATVKPDMAASTEWRRAILPLALIPSIQMISAQAGIIVLGFYRPEADVGIYKVAASAGVLAAFGLQISNVVIQPHIARLYAAHDTVLLQRLATAGALGSALLTVPVFIVFAAGGERLLGLLYGEAFTAAWVPLMILASGQVINAAFGSVGLLLSMTGHERDSVRWLSIAAAFNVSASLILIPAFGIIGAAVANASSVVIWNVGFRRAGLKKIGVDGTIFSYMRRSHS